MFKNIMFWLAQSLTVSIDVFQVDPLTFEELVGDITKEAESNRGKLGLCFERFSVELHCCSIHRTRHDGSGVCCAMLHWSILFLNVIFCLCLFSTFMIHEGSMYTKSNLANLVVSDQNHLHWLSPFSICVGFLSYVHSYIFQYLA